MYVYWDRIAGHCGGYYYCIIGQGWIALIRDTLVLHVHFVLFL